MGRLRLTAKNFTFGLRNEPEQLFGFATVRPSITEAALKRKVSADCPSQANRGHLPGHGESREKSAPSGRSGRFLACREQLVCRSTLFLPEFPATLRLRAASVTSGPLRTFQLESCDQDASSWVQVNNGRSIVPRREEPPIL